MRHPYPYPSPSKGEEKELALNLFQGGGERRFNVCSK